VFTLRFMENPEIEINSIYMDTNSIYIEICDEINFASSFHNAAAHQPSAQTAVRGGRTIAALPARDIRL
jgi:hypothetical protein